MKLKGTLYTDKKSISRLSTGAVHSKLDNTHVSVNTTLGESGGVSMRIELNGKVVFSEHWPIEKLAQLLANRK